MSEGENFNADRSDVDEHLESGEPEGRRMRAWQEWMMVGVGLTGLMSVLSVIVAAVALSATNNSSAMTVAAPNAMAATGSGAAGMAASTPPAAKTDAVTIKIKTDVEHGRRGPDGNWHDAFLPANFTVHPGDVVKVTVYNYDNSPHSFVSSTLSSDELINERLPGGSATAPRKTTFTFTAPTSPGRYLWWCNEPCDPYAMTHVGYMRGYVTVAA